MQNKKNFSIKEAIKYGFSAYIDNFWFYAKLTLMALGLFLIPIIFLFLMLSSAGVKANIQNLSESIASALTNNPILIISVIILGLTLIYIYLLSQTGLINVSLKIHDKEKVSLKDFFVPLSINLKFISTHILYMSIMLIGLLLLIIPGLIWALMFCYVYYLVVDKPQNGIIESFKESKRITYGAKKKLLLFGLLGLIFYPVFSFLPSIIFITMQPVIIIFCLANIYVYRQLQKQTNH